MGVRCLMVTVSVRGDEDALELETGAGSITL